jgi:flagellar motor switch protein FliM
MSDILSQSEIDALLSALSSGEVESVQTVQNKEEQEVKKYNFRSPKKFSKEHIRTLEVVHQNYARIISSFLTAQVRTNAQVEVAIVEQVTYEEFIKSISAPTILSIYRMPPLVGSLLFETNPQFVFQVLDILFGGPGTSTYKVREFTEIEKSVIRSFNTKLIENLKLAWEDVLDVQPQFLDVETNPALNQTMSPNEPVAIVTLCVKMNGLQTYINLCIPYIAIEKVLDKVIVHYRYTDSEENTKDVLRATLEKKMQLVPLNLTVSLGKVSIPISSFLDLQVGDVIQLDTGVEKPLDAYLEEKPHFKVLPGTYNKKKAVRIVEIIDEGVENYE